MANSIRNNFEYLLNKLNEAKSLPVSIGNTVIGAISADDERTIADLKATVQGAGFEVELKNFLRDEIGLPHEQHVETGFNILKRSQDPVKMMEYFKNRTLQYTSALGKAADPIKLAQDLIGLDASAAEQLFQFTWNSTPSTGIGEVWLSLMFKEGRRPNSKEKGDTIIDNKEFEVKGNGARLQGTHGYGDGKKMRDNFKTGVNEMCKTIGRTIPQNILDDSNKSDLSWNITKERSGSFGKCLKAMANEKPFDKREITAISAELGEVYKTYLLSAKIPNQAFVKAISENGDFDVIVFNKILLGIYYEYYLQIEKFKYIVLVSYPKGKTPKYITNKFLISTSDSKTIMSLFEKNILQVASTPSFGERASSQGASFAIQLR